MPRQSALSLAAQGSFSQVRAFAGDVLYTEGMPATQMYVVKDGEVDLYLVRDEKRTVVETLRSGQCFGFEPHLDVQTRIHCAAARTYCELVVFGNAQVAHAIAGAPELAQSLLVTQAERLASAHQLIASRVNFQPDLLTYAQLLHLLGMADVGKPAVGRGHGAPPPVARPLLQDVFTHARLMFGHSDQHIRGVLGKFLSLHLTRLEDEKGRGKQLVYSPTDIVEQARRIAAGTVDTERVTYQYISVDEFSALVDVERNTLLKKLAGSEFAEDLFTFRRAEIMRLLNEKGRRFFVDRKVKSPAEFTDVADLEFADAKSIFTAVSKVDAFELARLLATLEEGPARLKILGSLSKRRREEVEGELGGMGAVDPIEVQQIGKAVVDEVRQLMTAR